MDFTIVAPCFNEEGNIPELVSQFSELLKNRTNIKLIIVNNGSTDNSADILNNLCRTQSFLRAIHIKKNIGYGHGVVQGLRSAKSEFVCWMYGDLQSRPVDTMKAIKMMEDAGCPKDLYIKGLRNGQSLSDRFCTFLLGISESICLGKVLYDVNASPSLVHRDFLDYWKSPPDDYCLDLYAYYLAQRANFRMKRFQIDYLPRIHGISSWNYGLKAKAQLFIRFIKYSFQLKNELKK